MVLEANVTGGHGHGFKSYPHLILLSGIFGAMYEVACVAFILLTQKARVKM